MTAGMEPSRAGYLRKTLALLPAVLLLSLGIALCVHANLGSDVYTSFQQGIGFHLGVPVGTVHLVMSIALMLIYLVWDRSVVGIGSVLMCVLVGPCMTLFGEALGVVLPTDSMLLRVLLTFVGSGLVSVALAFYIPLNVGVQPMDMVVLTIAKLMNKTYGVAIYVFNGIMLLGTLALGGVIGIGTVINMLCVGKCIDFLTPRLQPLLRWINGVS